MIEMLGHRRRGPLAVARLERGEERLVLVMAASRGEAATIKRDHQRGARNEAAQELA